MRLAVAEAEKALLENEVPVGAVVVLDGEVISSAHNMSIGLHDMTAHAELLAMQQAAKQLNGRLDQCVLFVTLEPCAMCAGAAMNLRLNRIVFGAYDEVNGCCGSKADLTDHWFGHSIETIGGILEDECSSILSSFFQKKR